MTPYSTYCASEPIRFAPFAGLIDSLMVAVPRYTSEIAEPPRVAPKNAQKSKFARMTQNKLYAILVERGPMRTQDIRDAAGIPNTTTYNHLDAMADEGRVTRQKVVNGVIWAAV